MPRANRISIVGVAVAAVAVALAVLGFAQGRTDWRYELAGLADPFLGRPAFGFTLLVVLVASAAIGLVAFLVLRAGVQSQSASRAWWRAFGIVLAGFWLGYTGGALATIIGGGPRTIATTVAYQFGPPIATTIEVAATCKTPVGDHGVVAELVPAADGLPAVFVRNVATGEPVHAQPAGIGRVTVTRDGVADNEYPLPNVPSRPRPYIQSTAPDGTVRNDPPIGFLQIYDFAIVRLDANGLAAEARLEGRRQTDPFSGGSLRWVNLELPNDPWPATMTVTMRWSCGV